MVESLDEVARGLRERGSSSSRLVGGKARRLAWLRSARAPTDPAVPDGFVVTTRTFDRLIARRELRSLVHRVDAAARSGGRAELVGAAAELRGALRATRLPDDALAAIVERVARLGAVAGEEEQAPAQGFAVRSSAVGEDDVGASFAGLHDSFLPVEAGAVEHAVLACMASLFNDRALTYRAARQLPVEGAAMAVLVHPALHAELGGVAFSRDPDSGRDDVVIEWASGGAGGVVDGSLTPQRAVVARFGDPVGSRAVAGDPGRGDPRLSPAALTEIARFATWAETELGAPVDLEWLRAGERTAVVQLRPLTMSAPSDRGVSPMAGDHDTARRLAVGGQTQLHGLGVGTGHVEGVVWRPSDPGDLDGVGTDAILVVDATDPSWLPAMRLAAAVITGEGGQTSHAAIVSRELDLLAVIGCDGASELSSGSRVAVRCADGVGTVSVISRAVDGRA